MNHAWIFHANTGARTKEAKWWVATFPRPASSCTFLALSEHKSLFAAFGRWQRKCSFADGVIKITVLRDYLSNH